MSVVHESVEVEPRSSVLAWLLPVALVLALVAGLVLADPGRWLDAGAPAAEEIVFEGARLTPGVIELDVRNGVAAPVIIAQVMVDDAFWAFEATPDAELGRFGAATLRIEYPWVEGEPHVIAIVTNTGLVWEHEIAVALETPAPGAVSLARYAAIGLLVGLVPVAIGMGFFPAMRDAPARWTNAILAFTLGLLAFLALDTVGEGLELAEALPGAFNGLGLLVGAALAAVLAVLGLERALRGRGASPGAALALMIAIGIGLHNLGEGLLIGSAFAIGSLALGSALILGFAVHNVTEGPAIVAPLATAWRTRAAASADPSGALARGGTLPWGRYLLLAGVAGLPTVLGAWLGGFTTGGVLPVLFFGLGAGAIAVVLVQVGGAMAKDEGGVVNATNVLAFALGYAIMFATGLLTSP